MAEYAGTGGRKLPVYLLLDCSGSMAGEPIVAVNEGLGQIYRLLSADPQAVETAYLSVIQFGERADQSDLVPVDQFVPPQLDANGRTAMGAAFHLLVESITNDLVLNDPDKGIHGDYRPLVFLLTDGRPTDNYRDEIPRLQALRGSRRPVIVALGCGPDVDPAMLAQVTDNVFLMHNMSPEAIKGFFKWMSGSIAKTSKAVAGGTAADLVAPAVPGIISYKAE